MKRDMHVVCYTLFFISFMLPLTAYGNPVPHEIGGIKLGTDITDYPHIESSNPLKEVMVTNWNGFARGMISYGICKNPGMIVKMRFKYQDTSKQFYKNTLKTFKARYGKPDTWAGDAFGIQHIWKWSFLDKDNNKIEMILQHNLKNTKIPLGTVVTLSYPDRIKQEKACFNKAHTMNSNNFDHANCGMNCPAKKSTDPKPLMIPQ